MIITPTLFFRGDLQVNPTTVYTVPNGSTAIITSIQVASYDAQTPFDNNLEDYTVAWVKLNGTYTMEVLAKQFETNASVFAREVLTAGMTVACWRAETADHLGTTSDPYDKPGTISIGGVLLT